MDCLDKCSVFFVTIAKKGEMGQNERKRTQENTVACTRNTYRIIKKKQNMDERAKNKIRLKQLFCIKLRKIH